MANRGQPDNIQAQLKQIGRTLGVLANKGTGELYKVGGWRLFKLMGDSSHVMLITTIGRKSGRRFSTPIGYIRDKDYIYVLTRRDNRPISNWFRNMRANGMVWLQIDDKQHQGQAETFEDDAHVREILEIWARLNPQYFRFLGVNLNGRKSPSEAEIASTIKKVVVGRIKLG